MQPCSRIITLLLSAVTLALFEGIRLSAQAELRPTQPPSRWLDSLRDRACDLVGSSLGHDRKRPDERFCVEERHSGRDRSAGEFDGDVAKGRKTRMVADEEQERVYGCRGAPLLYVQEVRTVKGEDNLVDGARPKTGLCGASLGT